MRSYLEGLRVSGAAALFVLSLGCVTGSAPQRDSREFGLLRFDHWFTGDFSRGVCWSTTAVMTEPAVIVAHSAACEPPREGGKSWSSVVPFGTYQLEFRRGEPCDGPCKLQEQSVDTLHRVCRAQVTVMPGEITHVKDEWGSGDRCTIEVRRGELIVTASDRRLFESARKRKHIAIDEARTECGGRPTAAQRRACRSRQRHAVRRWRAGP